MGEPRTPPRATNARKVGARLHYAMLLPSSHTEILSQRPCARFAESLYRPDTQPHIRA